MFSILAEHLGFSVWVLWSIVAVNLNSVGFAFTESQPPLLTSLLLDRLRAAGARPGDAVVLGAAGSSATGHFPRRIVAAGADLVTAPLLDGGEPDARLVERFRDGTLAVAPRLRSSAR